MPNLHQIAQQITDDVLGEGAYVRVNKFDPSKGETHQGERKRRPAQRALKPPSALYINIHADWESLWTVAEAEHQLRRFKFAGPGWYFTKHEALLVIPDGNVGNMVSPWLRLGHWGKKQKFRFMFYENSPIPSFNAIVNAPVRKDTRK